MTPSQPTAAELYATAITDAAIIEDREAAPLKPVVGDRVRVVTWTQYAQSYTPGESVVTDWGVTWVTLDGDLSSACKDFDKETLNHDLQELLGLPHDENERMVVILDVGRQALFRPCADPDLDKLRCDDTLPDNPTLEHLQFLAAQTALSYNIPDGYPWTRLGYTYNWGRAESEVGVTELVIRQGSSVQVIEVQSTQDHCAP